MKVTRSRPQKGDVIAPTVEIPKQSTKAYVPADDEATVNKVDYLAVIQRYADKVTNRGSAIRAKCVECSGGALSEVRECPITKCALWPFRMGGDPHRKPREDKPKEDDDEE